MGLWSGTPKRNGILNRIANPDPNGRGLLSRIANPIENSNGGLLDKLFGGFRGQQPTNNPPNSQSQSFQEPQNSQNNNQGGSW